MPVGEIKPAGGGTIYKKLDIQNDVVGLCPTFCMSYEGGKLAIDNKNCNHCMHCINTMPRPCGSAPRPAPPCSWDRTLPSWKAPR